MQSSSASPDFHMLDPPSTNSMHSDSFQSDGELGCEDVRLQVALSPSGSSSAATVPASSTPSTASASGSPPCAPSSSPPAAAFVDDVLQQEEDYLRVEGMDGYSFDWTREMAYWAVAVCTCFLSCLAAFWWPQLNLLRYRPTSLRQAEYVLVRGGDGARDLVPVERLLLTPEAYVPSTFGRMWLGPSGVDDPTKPSFVEPAERMLLWRHHRFILDPARGLFVRQREPLQDTAASLRGRINTGLAAGEHAARLRQFGVNQLQIMVPSYPALLMRDLFHPFFVFQIYSVILWMFEAYYIFAVCIAVIATVSLVTTLMETRGRLVNLAQMAKFECRLNVLRTDEQGTVSLQRVSSESLVVGDVVEVECGAVPCDLTLLSGGAVCNEAMLTGEAIPVIKTHVQLPLENQALVPLGIEPRSTLYAATRVLQLKPAVPGGKVYGMVVRTGFATTKGALILSILYPKPSSFQFVSQSYKFIASLFGLALLGFALSVWQLYDQDASPKTITLRGLDLITIVVPPSLPLALSVGTNFALMALKAHKLFCIQPSRINVAGKIQLMAFDKTGTLTAEGMEMRGVLASNNGSFSAFAPTMSATDRSSEDESHSHSQAQSPGVEGGSGLVVMGGKLLGWGERSSSPDDGEGFGEGINLSTFRSEQHNEQQPLPRDVKYCMGCCHALAHLDGALIGDPLEVEIYKASGGRLSDTSRDGFVCFVSFDAPYDGNRSSLSSQSTLNLGVRTQFEFVAALQRMSVIVQDVANPSSVSVYAKGSPEVMKSLCTPDSIPEDFDDKLREYAQKGYRIIAMGCKALDADMLQKPIEKEDLRRLCEAELRFLGLLVLENKVKPETAPTLRVLQDAKVRCVMVTGDNPVTGTAVAKECGLVPDNTRIFLAQLSHDAQGMARLHWHDTDAADAHAPGSMRLNPRTLQLEGAVSPGPDVRFELALTGAAYKYLEDRFLAESGHSNKWVWESDRERREEEEEGALSATRMFHTVLLNCLVFARMTPEQKASVVAHLQSLGIYVGFCGDGGNDAPALKMAHIGVSLSESEASIAAPFTYARPNISCIPVLLSEGRSSLMTSFQLFQYMAMYSVIQFSAVILLYFCGSVLGNWEYLLQDMFLMFPLVVFMGGTRATRALSVKRPSGNLLSATNILLVLGHMVICLCFQLIVLFSSKTQDDFISYQDFPGFDNGPNTYEATSIYLFSNFQYVFMALLFARGGQWKASILSNRRFMGWTLAAVVVCLALLFSTDQSSFFREEEVPVSSRWRALIFLLVLANALSNALFHLLAFPWIARKWKEHRRRKWPHASAYGKRKMVEGPRAKRWHRIRGRFEQQWNREHLH